MRREVIGLHEKGIELAVNNDWVKPLDLLA
ncbi:Uncharacterised protein [Shewanella baltica]|nr:Uncharacterised protein [Shewanella baltica]